MVPLNAASDLQSYFTRDYLNYEEYFYWIFALSISRVHYLLCLWSLVQSRKWNAAKFHNCERKRGRTGGNTPSPQIEHADLKQESSWINQFCVIGSKQLGFKKEFHKFLLFVSCDIIYRHCMWWKWYLMWMVDLNVNFIYGVNHGS